MSNIKYREAHYEMWMAPMGIGAIQPRWRGGWGECHPARYRDRYAHTPKSVIHLKVSQEITESSVQGKP
jgi:hypothetical protein